MTFSTDNTVENALENISGDDRFSIIRNTSRKLAAQNRYNGILAAKPNPEDIIVMIDGDDWLSGTQALQVIADKYRVEKCWMTYGSYLEYPSGLRGKFSFEYPSRVRKERAYRRHPWGASQPRTFKYWLWKNIGKKDMMDSGGKFYTMSGDMAFMFPMLEMGGHRSVFIKEPFYIYNLENPNNDHKIDNRLQRSIEEEIRNKPRYEKILEAPNGI